MQPTIPYELHITLADLKTADEAVFVAFCAKRQAKAMIIDLAKGDFIRQPMFTKVVYAANLESAIRFGNEIIVLLQQENFVANRLKIEIPSKDASRFENTFENTKNEKRYFEWHGKIEYKNTDDLLALCAAQQVHLSVNALKNEPNFRFITLREMGDALTFQNRIDSLLRALQNGNWAVLKTQSEYCLYDTNIDLDKNWL